MTRARVLALVAVLIALAGAVAYRVQDRSTPPAQSVQGRSTPPAQAAGELAPFRAAAALDPCPAGISTDLPDLVLPCLGGGPDVPLRGVPTGMPTLVNVYGSWCAPCADEMPILVDFSRKAAGKVALVGVDTVDEPRLALIFAKDLGQHWPAVVDDDKAVLRKYASGPPVTLFVDGAGKVVHVKAGPFRSLADLQALVRTHLGVAT